MSVFINKSDGVAEYSVSSDKLNLKFEPERVKNSLYNFKCDSAADIGKMIQINSVLLTLGFFKEREAKLKFNIANGTTESCAEKTTDEFQYFRW